MDDIDKFQTRIDEVKGKGQRVIDGSGGQPKVKDEVQSKLSNLDDSYVSLQATALQIKVCQIEKFFVQNFLTLINNIKQSLRISQIVININVADIITRLLIFCICAHKRKGALNETKIKICKCIANLGNLFCPFLCMQLTLEYYELLFYDISLIS